MAVTELLQREINRGKGKPQSRRLEFAQHILRAFALTRSERIRKRSDFQAAYRLGRRFNSRHFVVIARITGLNHTRIGLSVSKKTGSAVYRNFLKRRIRETFRTNKKLFCDHAFDLVIITKKGFTRLCSQEIFHELQQVLKTLSSVSY